MLTESTVFKLFTPVIDLVFPPLCGGCRRVLITGEQGICLHCRGGLPVTPYFHSYHNPITHSLLGRVRFRHATAYLNFAKDGIVQNMMHSLKYRGNRKLGIELGRMAGSKWKRGPAVLQPDLVLGVPISSKKKRSRGYNQAEMIARGVAEELQVPYSSDALVRSGNKGSQTKLGRYARWRNVSEAFVGLRYLGPRHILLVDDTFTTGSTMEACGQVLWKLGIRDLSILAIAYAK